MERLVFVNDGSQTDASGNPTGKGLIQCTIYDPNGGFVGTFPADGTGIGALEADDAGIGAVFTRNPTSCVDVRFLVAGAVHAFRSYDDGRTWRDITGIAPVVVRAARRARPLAREMPGREQNN